MRERGVIMAITLYGKRSVETRPSENEEAKKIPKHMVTRISSHELQGIVTRTIQKMTEYNVIPFLGPALKLPFLDRLKPLADQGRLSSDKVANAVGEWISTIALSPAPARSYPNLDALEESLISSKIAFLSEILKDFDIKQITQIPSFSFPFYAVANFYPEPGKPVCYLTQQKIWKILHRFIYVKKDFAERLRGPLQDFFLRLTGERPNDLFTSSDIQDIILNLIEKNFLDRIKFRTLFFREFESILRNFTELSQLSQVAKFCEVAKKMAGEGETKENCVKFLPVATIEMLRTIYDDTSSDAAICRDCELILKFVDPLFKERVGIVINLMDTAQKKLTVCQRAALEHYSPFLKTLFTTTLGSKARSVELTSRDFEFFLRWAQPDIFPRPLIQTLQEWKAHLDKAAHISFDPSSFFALLEPNMIGKGVQNLIQFLCIQDELYFDDPFFYKNWVDKRDAILSFLLEFTSQKIEPSNREKAIAKEIEEKQDFLKAVVEVTGRYPRDDEHIWMQIKSLTIHECIFPVSTLTQLVGLEKLTVRPKIGIYNVNPPPELKRFPKLHTLIIEERCSFRLTTSNSVRVLELPYSSSFFKEHLGRKTLFPALERIILRIPTSTADQPSFKQEFEQYKKDHPKPILETRLIFYPPKTTGSLQNT